MLWAALLLPTGPDASPPCSDALRGLATWALQFTPRVATVDEAVVMEVEGSVRLYGGRKGLRDRVMMDAQALGVDFLAWAPNSLAALALARARIANGFRKSLTEMLDPLTIQVLSATSRHRVTLSQIGCHTLGDLRALPRGGVSRRFDKELLTALDQAYGLRPEVHAWITVPESFVSRLELMSRVELAPALLFGVRRLLMQLCGWLAARQAGVTALTLQWAHDAMRAKHAGDGGEFSLRTATATRDLERLCRLLAEHLAKIELKAPVGDLTLIAVEVVPLEMPNGALLPDPVNQGESLALVLERIAARLGPERVRRPVLREDHRLEWMQHWQSAAKALPRKPARAVAMPQPTCVLKEPLRLACKGSQPMYQGPLQLLTGPHRVEGGWWHRVMGSHAGSEPSASQHTLNVQRDYWVALSAHAGVLWVFQTRLGRDETAWYLHGSFA